MHNKWNNDETDFGMRNKCLLTVSAPLSAERAASYHTDT
jgi:hypothetical protein